MKKNKFKIPMVFLFFAVFSISCQDDTSLDENQVYNQDLELFTASMDIVGEPLIPIGIHYYGYIPASTTNDGSGFPWTIEGRINNGKMDILFINDDRNLTPNYEGVFTEGARIAEVKVRNKNNRNLYLALHKESGNIRGRIYIYYADRVFSKFNDGTVVLEKGWNFIEVINDYDQNIFRKVKSISRDINDFLKDGYRWTIEMWI